MQRPVLGVILQRSAAHVGFSTGLLLVAGLQEPVRRRLGELVDQRVPLQLAGVGEIPELQLRIPLVAGPDQGLILERKLAFLVTRRTKVVRGSERLEEADRFLLLHGGSSRHWTSGLR